MPSSPSSKRSPYVSRACDECRRRRCKCDGEQPICGTCMSNKRECSWSTEHDARRPATKQRVEDLHARIWVLEAELTYLKNRHSVPAVKDDTPSPLDNVLALPDHPQGSRCIEDLLLPVAQMTQMVTYRYIFQIDTSIPINQQPKDVQLSLVCPWDRYLPPLVSLTRLEHDTLLSRCFGYGTSWLHCMTPEPFLHDMLYAITSEHSITGHRLRNYSPMLHCSLLAFASAFSDNPEIRSLPVRAELAQCAKRWLDLELRHPAASLVRALALLAEYHCGIGEREAGFIYMGMSSRAARFLMHRDGGAVASSGDFDPFPQSINLNWHIWSAFTQDKIMALEYMKEYDMPVPRLDANLSFLDLRLESQSRSSDPTGSLLRLTTRVFLESCKLMIIATKIIDLLCKRVAMEEQTAIDIHLQLDVWFNSLPRELLVWARSTSPLPHMIMLHICYWYLIICLHQPSYNWIEGADASGEADAGEGPSKGATRLHDLSVKMTERATHKIVQQLQVFADQHGMVFFPRNMIRAIQQCGLALLREAACAPATATRKRSNAFDGVSVCARALRGASRAWPRAEGLAIELEQKVEQVEIQM